MSIDPMSALWDLDSKEQFLLDEVELYHLENLFSFVSRLGFDPNTFFQHGRLRGINFSNVDIEKVSFRGSDLSGAIFTDHQCRFLLNSRRSDANQRAQILDNIQVTCDLTRQGMASGSSVWNKLRSKGNFRPNLSRDTIMGNYSTYDFSDSDLVETQFVELDLRRTKFNGSRAQSANFSAANLKNTMVEGGDFSSSLFNFALLDHANFHKSRLVGSSFQYAMITNGSVTYCDARDAVFSKCEMDQTDVSWSDFERANFRRSLMCNVTAEGTLFQEADLSGALLESFSARGTSFFGANLSNVELTNSELYLARFDKSYFSDSTISSSSFDRCSFEYAVLFNSTVEDCDFTGCNMGGVNFGNSKFDQTILTGVLMNDANLKGADLSGAIGLSQLQLESAYGDRRTVIPNGLLRPESWFDSEGSLRQPPRPKVTIGQTFSSMLVENNPARAWRELSD